MRRRKRHWFHRWEHVGFVDMWNNIADPIERYRCTVCDLTEDRKALP